MTTISCEENKKHNTLESCWITAHNKVYDVTEFIKIHPPEGNVIMNNLIRTGSQDCTISYNYHSDSAKKIWKKYL